MTMWDFAHLHPWGALAALLVTVGLVCQTAITIAGQIWPVCYVEETQEEE